MRFGSTTQQLVPPPPPLRPLKVDEDGNPIVRPPAEAPAASSASAKPSKGKKKKEEEEASTTTSEGLQQIDEGTLKHAVCTGVLASRKDSKDVKIQAFSISLFGKQLFEDQTFELTWGHRYGVIAQNGAGKTTLLKTIAARLIPIPDFIDIWYLDHEAPPSDKSAVDFVVDTVRLEKERLEALEETILTESGPEDARLEIIYEKLDKMDPSTFDKRAGKRCVLAQKDSRKAGML